MSIKEKEKENENEKENEKENEEEVPKNTEVQEDFISFEEPFTLFGKWLVQAKEKEYSFYDAFALATTTRTGFPSVRMLLLKDWDRKGFVFYTNLNSRKAKEISENLNAAMCFYWRSIQKQIRIEGQLEPVTDQEADTYFATRPRISQLGAWASKQSEVLTGKWELEKRISLFTMKYPLGEVPRPPHWSGFRLKPAKIEFWQERPFRLHHRILFTLSSGKWKKELLYP